MREGQDTFNDTRARVQGLGRTILDLAWRAHTESNGAKWPSITEFAIPHGVAEVDAAIVALPAGAAYVEQEHVQVTLLGALLGTSGQSLEDHLVAFLLWLQERAPKDPANRVFKGDEMPSTARLSSDEFRNLGLGVRLLEIHDGAGPGAGRWHFRASAEIANIVHAKDVRAYLRARALSIADRISTQRALAIAPKRDPVPLPEAPAPDTGLTWGPIRAVLRQAAFATIKEVAGLAGISPMKLAHHKSNTSASKSALLDDIDDALNRLPPDQLQRTLTIFAEEVAREGAAGSGALDDYLSRLGWIFTDGRLVRLEVLDPQDLSEVPSSARHDLLKAATRYRDGDLGGALSSACGAVDAATTEVYVEEKLGDPGEASFQERVSCSLAKRGTLVTLQADLVSIGWDGNEAFVLRKNLVGSINQAAYVMQTLRSGMADVHGSRPLLKPLVFDAIKWAMLILRMLRSIEDV